MTLKLALVLCNLAAFVSGSETHDSVCFTADCLRVASRIRSWMNSSVDPCDDFHRFACGGFSVDTFRNGSAIRVNPFVIAQQQIERQLAALIKSESDSKAFNISKKFYDLCLSDESEDNEVTRAVSKQFGATSGDWIEWTVWLKRMGLPFNVIFELTVARDFRNTSNTVLKIKEPKVDDIFNERLLEGLAVSPVALESYRNFSGALRNVILSKETPHPTFSTIKKFQAKYSYLNWSELFEENVSSSVKLTKATEILVANPKYFAELRNLLQETDPKIISSYFLIKTLVYVQKLRTRNFSENDDRERWCLGLVRGFPGLGALYARTYLPSIPRNALRIVRNLKRSLRKLIRQSDWIGSASKISALEKLEQLYVQVGYPEDFLNASRVDSYYLGFETKNDDFVTEVLRLNTFKSEKLFRLLVQKRAPSVPRFAEVLTPNVLYDIDRNSASIPVAVMQGDFFHQRRPNFVNYASFGSLVGYAISSAFGADAHVRDRHGNSIDRWDDETKQGYLNRTKCISDAAVIDFIGARAANEAYRDWAKRHADEKDLPFLNLTPHQLFWVTMTQNYCSESRDSSDPKTYLRTNQVLRNLDSFAEDFKCPPTAPMVAQKKCSLL